MAKKSRTFSRRKFLWGTTAGAASLNLLPGHAWADSPNGKLQVAFIGAGGRGAANVGGTAQAGEVVHALADCDQKRCLGTVQKYGGAKFYIDWREMLEKEGDKIDAVAVSTPDHNHAVTTMAAIKLGKHVYVEKPLTLTISEARALHKEANARGLCTQMGNTGHARDGARLTNEWVRGGIGTVSEIHCRTNRPSWPQDCVRPPEAEVPPTVDWDLWIGPAAMKPFSPEIVPFKWRGLRDYGTGALGDMGAHIIDHPVWALGLGLPERIEVEKADRKNTSPQAIVDSHPASCIIHYHFAAKGDRGPVKLTWFDGEYTIPRVDGMPEDKKTPDNGCVYFGSGHVLMHGSHGGNPEIIDANRAAFKAPEQTEERSPGHYVEWFDAIRAGDPSKAKSNFDVAAPLTETLLLGVMAGLQGPGTTLTWDAEKMTTGNADADKLVQHSYREGWSL